MAKYLGEAVVESFSDCLLTEMPCSFAPIDGMFM